MIQPILINLHPNKHTQGLHYYPFAVNLDRCVQSCNTLNDLSNRVCISKENRRFELKRFQYDYRDKWIENINKAYILWM